MINKTKILNFYYNRTKSVKENISYIESKGFKVGKSKVYQWLKKNKIKTNIDKLTDSDIERMIDYDQSIYKNFKKIKDMNYKLDYQRLIIIYNKNKSRVELKKLIVPRWSLRMNYHYLKDTGIDFNFREFYELFYKIKKKSLKYLDNSKKIPIYAMKKRNDRGHLMEFF